MVMAVGFALKLGRAVLREKERDATGQHREPPFCRVTSV
jgi:hypothetical protein